MPNILGFTKSSAYERLKKAKELGLLRRYGDAPNAADSGWISAEIDVQAVGPLQAAYDVAQFIASAGALQTHEVAANVSVSRDTALRWLKKAEAAGLVRRVGGRRIGRWKRTRKQSVD